MVSGDGADEAALERSHSVALPLDVDVATELLTEVGQIMARLGVVFFLRQGTCLGAIRDNGFIPWDDDLDIGSVLGLHGLTEETIDKTASAFDDSGYFVKVEDSDRYVNVSMMKSSTRIDWACYRIVDDSIFHFPGVRIPASLFAQLKEIDFIDAKFLVPNPPEDYLRCKYGDDWRTPKAVGFEKDVLELIPDAPLTGIGARLRRLRSRYALPTHAGKLRVLDRVGKPVAGAEVRVAGVGHSRTDRAGYTRFHLPRDDWYALVIKYDEHEELLYQERLNRGRSYVYREDPSVCAGRLSILSTE